MKRKVRIEPAIPFYSNEPAVSRTNIADKPPVPNTGLANDAPPGVVTKPSRMSGIAGFADKSGPRHGGAKVAGMKIGAPSPKQGSLRMSGHAGAHRIGLKKP